MTAIFKICDQLVIFKENVDNALYVGFRISGFFQV